MSPSHLITTHLGRHRYGMSHPTPQVCLRCNVDVKYLGRCPTDSDMQQLEEEFKQHQMKKKDSQKNPHKAQ